MTLCMPRVWTEVGKMHIQSHTVFENNCVLNFEEKCKLSLVHTSCEGGRGLQVFKSQLKIFQFEHSSTLRNYSLQNCHIKICIAFTFTGSTMYVPDLSAFSFLNTFHFDGVAILLLAHFVLVSAVLWKILPSGMPRLVN